MEDPRLMNHRQFYHINICSVFGYGLGIPIGLGHVATCRTQLGITIKASGNLAERLTGQNYLMGDLRAYHPQRIFQLLFRPHISINQMVPQFIAVLIDLTWAYKHVDDCWCIFEELFVRNSWTANLATVVLPRLPICFTSQHYPDRQLTSAGHSRCITCTM